MTEQITPKRTYILICAALLLLTLLTYAAAFVSLGPLNTLIALAIAAIKAVLIIMFFMHARYSTGITRVVIGAGLLWLGILIIGTMDDFITRGWLGIPGK
jgi:cytochrome c oxidase subunit 4